ncbi:MAG TPA: hypothetical protein VGM56_31110 [Byssovorax sp.]|jgi:hypothetical protein
MTGLAVDASGRVGFAIADGGYDCGDGLSSTSDSMGQIAVFEDGGALAWEHTFAGATYYFPFSSLGASRAGDWTLLATLAADVDVGCGTMPARSGSTFAATFDASGACLHQWPIGPIGLPSVAIDPNDDAVVIAGGLAGTIDLGSSMLTPVGGSDVLILRLDPTLAPVWGLQFGDAAAQSAQVVAIDPATSEITIGGSLAGTVDFGQGPMSPPGDAYVATFTSAGDSISSGHWGDSHTAETTAVAIGSAGDVFASGFFAGTMNFGGGVQIQAATTFDGFLAKLPLR